VEEALIRYRNHPGVLAVQPNHVSAALRTVPNDPLLSHQWSLAPIQAFNAWELTTGSTNVVAAVIDSGVDYLHEDLSPIMWRNPGEIPGNGIDDDGNGYVDDIHGVDTSDNDSDPMDLGVGTNFLHHGTMCAAIMAAAGNNGKGTAGVIWNVQLMAVRAFSTNNTIIDSDMLEGLEYLLMMRERGVNLVVANMSWGDGRFRQAAKDAHDALGHAGILQPVACGNEAQSTDFNGSYPDNYASTGIISVAASDQLDNLASYSNWGRTNVDLAAPGTAIYVPYTNGTYTTNLSGTSFAAPHVSGAIALMAAAYPDSPPAHYVAALFDSVDRKPAFTNRMVTHGRLNLARALSHPLLRSNRPPWIVTHPEAQKARLGSNAVFRVEATSSTPLTYQWFFNGSPIEDAADSSLTVNAVQPANEGLYTVLVQNEYGAAMSDPASLVPLILPVIIEPPLSQAVVVGGNVTLSVGITGYPPPFLYQWRRGSTILTNIVLTESNCFFTVHNLQLSQGGTYRIVITNAAQSNLVINSTFNLTVLTDADSDGIPDTWEDTYGLNRDLASDAADDFDHDGSRNRDEYLAGTNPTNALSVIKIDSILLDDTQSTVLEFHAISNRTYSVEARAALIGGSWENVLRLLAAPTNRMVRVVQRPNPTQRFYRLVTP
jgi:subtilisin family serine protease